MYPLTKTLIGGAMLLATAPAFAVNLVTNGSFETGDFSDWNPVAAGIGSQFSVQPEATLDGQYAAYFAASGMQYDSISQLLATTPGTTYTISMWVKNYGIENDSLQIGWENGAALTMTPVGTGLESWQYVSVDAVATMAGSILSIRGYDNQASFFVDDVQVQAVPEPSSLALLGGGAVALLRSKRSQKTLS